MELELGQAENWLMGPDRLLRSLPERAGFGEKKAGARRLDPEARPAIGRRFGARDRTRSA